VSERERDRYEWKTRGEWRGEIRALCARMNAAGATPQWTRRSLREYANEKFGVLLGVDALSFDQLTRLRDDLKNRLGGLEASAEEAA
jgi:hypothetical protein